MSATSGAAERSSIAVEGLVKTYDGRRVVDGVSLEVRRGEIVGLLGPNGAGKTTTVEIIEGYRRPDDGRVEVLGSAPGAAGREHRARVGLMLQGGGGVDPRLSSIEALRFHAALHATPRDPAGLVEEVGLATVAGTPFRGLSGGERQRLGVALAIVGQPDVVVLDEPTAGMDVEGRGLIRDLVGRLRDEGVAVLMTSHDLVDVERLADRIVILDRGRVVADGRPAELGRSAAAGLTIRTAASIGADDRRQLEGALGRLSGTSSVRVVEDMPGALRVEGAGPPTPALIAELAAWLAARGILATELRAGSESLEELYLRLVGSERGETP